MEVTVSDRSDDRIVHPMGRTQPKFLAGIIEHVDRAGLGVGELSGLGDDGGQDGFEIDGRIHRLADLAERAQLADRLGKLAGAALHLLEQTDVLDRDHRLVGKRLNQLDLLGAEWQGLGACQYQRPNRISFPQQRDGEVGSVLPEFLRFEERVFRVGKNIGNMNRFAFERHSPDGCPTPWSDRMTLVKFLEFTRKAVMRGALIGRALTTKYNASFGVAHAGCRLRPACRVRSADRMSSG